MECNKEEASRAKDLAVVKLQEADYAGAKRIALKAQKLFPGLENISQLLTVCEVHCCAAVKINGETDWYGILQVETTADDMLLKKQYRKLALLLHPDKNKFVGAEAAFKLIGEAHMMLTHKAKRSRHDPNWNSVIPKSAPKKRGRPSKKTDYANKENTDAGYSTFWTICLTCGTKYQYPCSLWLEFLWCEICSKSFRSFDMFKKPFVGVETSNLWSGFGMQHQMSWSQWINVANQQHNYQSVPTQQNPITGHPIGNSHPWGGSGIQQEMCPSSQPTHVSDEKLYYQRAPGQQNPVNGHQSPHSHPWGGSGIQQEMCPPSQPTNVSDQKLYYERAPGQQNPINGHQTPHSYPWGGYGMQQEMCPPSQPTHVSDIRHYQRALGLQNPVDGHQTPHSHPWGGYGMQQKICPQSQPIHVFDQEPYYQRAPGQQNPVDAHQTPVTNCQQQSLEVVDKNTSVTTQQQSTKPPFNSGPKNVVSSQGADFTNNNATANNNLTAEAGACDREKITKKTSFNGEDRTKSPVVNSDKVHLVNEQMQGKEVATGSSRPVAINGSQVATKDVLTATSPDKTPGKNPCTASQERNNVVVEDGSDGCGEVSDHLPDSPAKKRIRKEHSSDTGGKSDHATENEVAEANSQHKYSIPSKEKVTNEKKEVISGLNHDADARSVNNSSPCNVKVSCPDSDLFVRSSNEAPFLIPSGNPLCFSDSIPFRRLAETDRKHIPNGALELDTASLPSDFFEGTLPSDLENAFIPLILDTSFMSTCQVPVGKTKQNQDGTGRNVKDEVEKLNQNTKIEQVNLDSSFVSTRDGNTQCKVPSTSSCQVPVGKTKQSQDYTGTNVKDEVEKLNQNTKIEPVNLDNSFVSTRDGNTQDGTGTKVKDEVEKLNQNTKIKPWFLRREGKTWRVFHSRATPRRA